ncbi:unnamed protein product [Gadus morhua 'NCC']
MYPPGNVQLRVLQEFHAQGDRPATGVAVSKPGRGFDSRAGAVRRFNKQASLKQPGLDPTGLGQSGLNPETGLGQSGPNPTRVSANLLLSSQGGNQTAAASVDH